MNSAAHDDRLSLAALLRDYGPSAPTLCAGWQALDLAVHAVMRDRHALGLAGEHVAALRDNYERTNSSLRDMPWTDLVALVAAGPQRWRPQAWLGALVNSVEFFIHLEDLRRAQPGWQPRNLGRSREQEFARVCRLAVPAYAHKNGVRVRANLDNGPILTGGRPSSGPLVLAGKASEVLLYLSGRQTHARVSVEPGQDS